jgi:hypothetical protein
MHPEDKNLMRLAENIPFFLLIFVGGGFLSLWSDRCAVCSGGGHEARAVSDRDWQQAVDAVEDEADVEGAPPLPVLWSSVYVCWYRVFHSGGLNPIASVHY